MRIYNATNSQLNLPFPGGNVSIAPHSVSGNLGANTSSISMLVSAYSTREIAFIVSGPFELNLCSSIPTVVNYVVQSLEEAIEKLEPKKAVVEEVVEEKKEAEPVKKEVKAKHVKKEKEAKKEVVVEEPKIEKVEEDTVITIAESEEPAAEPYEPAVEEDYVKEPEDKDFYADDKEEEDPASEL
jgi:hypothetical protein